MEIIILLILVSIVAGSACYLYWLYGQRHV
jgi:nitrogen fixation-related uncharacterized protein